MFNKNKVIIISLVFLLFITMSVAFAENNENLTDNKNILNTDSNHKDIYFNASADHDGDGSKENPYKTLNSGRIMNNSNLHLSDGEYFVNTTNVYIKNGSIITSTILIRYNLDHYFAFNALSNVSFYGQSADKTIIRGFDNYSLNFKDSLSLNNITFINNNIVFDGGNLNLNNVVFKDSKAHYLDDYYNKLGSAITIRNPSNIEIYDSKFINLTSEYGGAIYMDYGNLKVVNSSFINTTSTILGGSIYANSTEVNISKSKFKNSCAVNGDGGAIYVSDSILNIFDSNFTNCQAGFGSGICTLNSTSNIDNSYFSNNKNEYASGAIFAMFGDLTIANSKFLNNSDGNTYSIIISDITANLTNNSFENKYDEILAYYSSLKLFNNNGLYDKIVEINEFSFYRNYNNCPLFKFNLTQFTGELPEYYSLVDEGYVSPVKNQKNGGNCWSFTAMAVIESCILKLTNKTYDLSEQNLKNLMAKYSNWGWNSKTNDGGKVPMAIGYLTSWLGPILDITDRYSDISTLSHVYDEIIHIDNVLLIKRDNYTDNDQIKRAILTYGAVAGDLMYHDIFLNNNNAYYCDVGYLSNHAITIVGWNDTYSRFNFKETPDGKTPDGDGAWIVKNSWGTSWGDNGYFYVSYYDETLSKKDTFLYTVILNNTKHYDKNYQYEMGYTTILNFDTDSVIYKNIFTATDDEYLQAVSTYFFNDVDWTINIYVNNTFKTNKSGKSGAGYYTFDLDEIVPLKKGDNFTVEIVQKTNGSYVAFPVSEYDNMNRNVLRENISFYKNGNGWYDMYTMYNGVICIKAFTIKGYYAEISLNVTSNNITAIVKDDQGKYLTDGEIIFNINGAKSSVKIENGIATLSHNFTEGTYYDISATLNSTSYNNISESLKIIPSPELYLTINNTVYGDKIVFNITSTKEIDFNYNVIIVFQDKNYTIPISNKTTLYNISDKFDVGNYTADLIYKGYFKTYTKTVHFNITKADNNINVTVENSNYFDGANITVKADIDDIYNVLINGKVINVTVINGFGSNKTILPVGKYDANISWVNSNYNSKITNTTFWINKTDISMDLNVTVEDNTIKIHVNASKPINEEIILFVNNDNKQIINLTNGEVNVNYTAPLGKYNITLLFNNTNFNSINKTVTCSVNSYDVVMKVYVNNISVGDNLNISVVLNSEISTSPSGSISIFIADINETLNITSNVVNVSIVNLAVGNHTLNVTYSGDKLYNSKSQEILVTVSKISPVIEVVSNETDYNGEVKIIVSGGLSENITFYLNDTTMYSLNTIGESLDPKNSFITFNNLNAGEYDMKISYPGDDRYLPINLFKKLIVNRLSTSLDFNSLSSMSFKEGDNIPYSVTLKDSKGNATSNKKIVITFDNIEYSAVTGSDGVANFVLSAVSGGYKNIMIRFDGDNNYIGCSSTDNVNIDSSATMKYTGKSKVKTILKVPKKTYRKSAKNKIIKATLKDAKGNKIKKGKLMFKVKSKKYYSKTNSKGEATVKVKISKKGSYKVMVYYGGNNNYLPVTNYMTLKIK